MLLCGIAALAACTSHADPHVRAPSESAPLAPSATAATHAQLRCAPIWTGPSPEPGARTYLNTVAIRPSAPKSGTFDAHQAPHPLMAKVWLDVHAHRSATLTLTHHWTHHVAFTWARDAQLTPWTTALAIPPCPRAEGHAWLAFPGGFTYDHPVCLPIRLTVGNRSVTIHESVGGAPCP